MEWSCGQDRDVRTRRLHSAIRALAGSAGDYNAMLIESTTIRIDMPAGSTVEVIARILGALARIEAGST